MSATARRFRARRRAIVSPEIRDDATHAEKEGAARRRLVALTGACPCGARMPDVDPAPGTFTIVAVEHEPGCPAIEK